MTLYGSLVTNAFFNTSLTNIQDIPLTAGKQGSDALGNDKSFGMTVRQSRLGMRYKGTKVGNAVLSGQVELDFLGGNAALGNGISMDLVRLRLAVGRIDWKSYSLVAGQDWSVFAPLNPTTLAEYAIPGLSASGNPWIRSPQFRVEMGHISGAAEEQPGSLTGFEEDQPGGKHGHQAHAGAARKDRGGPKLGAGGPAGGAALPPERPAG